MKGAPESVKQLIRKVHVLSCRGVAGEAETAKRKLNELLEKHNITLDDIVGDLVKTYDFSYKTVLDYKLIRQCYDSLAVDTPGVYYYKLKGKELKTVGLDLTPTQYLYMRSMLDYYRVTWEKEVERLFFAFVQQHKLYSPHTGKEKESTMCPEEKKRILALMRGLEDPSYHRQTGILYCGVNSESETAKRKLNELLEKHKIALTDVANDLVKTYNFTYKTDLDYKLIRQCYDSIAVDNPRVYHYKLKILKLVGFDLTATQYLYMRSMLDYYRVTWEKEVERLFFAFVQQHKLYSPPTSGEKESSMNPEEKEFILALMRGLEDPSYFRPAGIIT